MKKHLSEWLLLLLCVLFWTNVAAQNKVEPFYTTEQLPDLIQCLPAPPDTLDSRFEYDVIRYRWGKEQRENKERAAMAVRDADWTFEGLFSLFDPYFGLEISRSNTPEIWTLLERSITTTDQMRVAPKAFYHRVRPFEFFNEHVLTIDEEHLLRGEGSYPSGHTIRGWVTALLLAEINPDGAEGIFHRAWEHGESRVIVGAHWQSDVDASRLAASIGCSALHTSPEFLAQMAKARKEFQTRTRPAAPTATPATAAPAASDTEKGGKRVVFIGDSITDGNWGIIGRYKPTSAQRNHTDMNHIYGHSYVMLIASHYQSRWPDKDYRFYNRGFSGHKLPDLAARWKEDVLDLHPDVLTVLVGTNDVGEHLSRNGEAPFDVEAWKSLYRSLLQQVRAQNPSVELVLCTPFVAKEGKMGENPRYPIREQLTEELAMAVRELCKEFGAACMPYDEMFRSLIRKQPRPCTWIWDGIHPTPAGHRRMAEMWIKKIGKI